MKKVTLLLLLAVTAGILLSYTQEEPRYNIAVFKDGSVIMFDFNQPELNKFFGAKNLLREAAIIDFKTKKMLGVGKEDRWIPIPKAVVKPDGTITVVHH